MFRNLLDSSTNILLFLGLSPSPTASIIGEVSAAAIEIADSKVKDLVCNKEEYDVIPAANEHKLSTPIDPVIKQLMSLLCRKEFNILIKVASSAIQNPLLHKNEQTYLEHLDSIEDIIKQAKKNYCSTVIREKLDSLHDDIIAQRTELHKRTTSEVRSYHR